LTLTSTPERRTHGKAGTERRIACAKIVAPRLSDYRGQLEPAYPDCLIVLSDIPFLNKCLKYPKTWRLVAVGDLLVAREALALSEHEFLSNLISDFQKFLLPLKLPGSQNALFLALLALEVD